MTSKRGSGPGRRGGNIGIAEKVQFVEYVINGGNISDWARDRGRAVATAHRLLDDPKILRLFEAAERGQERRFAAVVEKAYQIAMDPDHIHWGSAANFLARFYGKFKDKHEFEIVERVAYVQPGTLARLAEVIVNEVAVNEVNEEPIPLPATLQ